MEHELFEVAHLNVTASVRVKQRPAVAIIFDELEVDPLGALLNRVLETLQYDGDEQVQEDERHDDDEGHKVCDGNGLIATPNRFLVILYVLFVSGILAAFI